MLASATREDVVIRSAAPADAAECARICYEAFAAIAANHGFPPDFPDPQVALELVSHLIDREDVYSVVAEIEGRLIGSNFLWEQGEITGVGPVTVDANAQNRAAGRALMQSVLDRADATNAAGIRLVQAGYHARSLCLYTKLGFDVKAYLVNMQGPALHVRIPGRNVRPATFADFDACNALCARVHGHERGGELRDGIARGTTTVVENEDGITGYSTMVGFFGHSVATTNDDLKALIGAAGVFPGPGFLLPADNSEVFRWCLDNNLRMVQGMVLMVRGRYTPPIGPYLPSILF